MTTNQPIIISGDEEEEAQVEPGYVPDDLLQRIITEEVLPKPLKPKEINTINQNVREALVLNQSGQLLEKYITWEGFGDHHIEIYDNWIENGMLYNIHNRMLEFKDGRVICFEGFIMLHARYTRDGKAYPLTPKMAREQGITYGGDCHVDMVLRRDNCRGEELDRRNAVCIGNVPIMLKSMKCILHGKTPYELALYGEDPYDPFGYYIVEGVEKVCLLQEQLAVNKILLMNIDSKGTIVARMTANTPRGTALIELILDKDTHSIIEMKFPSMRVPKQDDKQKDKRNSINVLQIFRLFGITDPTRIQNIIALFMKPEHIKKSMFKLTRNLVDFVLFDDIFNIIAAKMDKSNLTNEEKEKEARRILDTDLFPHLNNLPGPDNETIKERDERIALSKIYLLSIMIARFLEYLAGYRALDDRDSWSNKRAEARMVEQLFRNAWRKTLSIVQAAIETGTIRDLGGAVEKLQSNIITDTFRDSFITSNWGVKGKQMKNNVAQTLVRDSVVATFAHINTVDVGISRTDRQVPLRLVQNSQWGFIDPTSTPEGENAGILKNLCILAKLSLERSDTEIIRHLIGDTAKNLVQRVSTDFERVRDEWPDKIIVNGKFLGWCHGEETANYLIALRRNSSLPQDMSVIKEDDWIYVDIGPSRLVRPLLIVDPDQQLIIDKLGLRGASNHELLRNGAMEYISSWEQEYIKIATSVDLIRKRLEIINDAEETYRVAVNELERVKAGQQIIIELDGNKVVMDINEASRRFDTAQENINKIRKNRPYTHCELDPQAILGVAAALIPWPNHNQAPRNTYQVSMGKQALGEYHSNHLNRMDGKTKLLAFPQRPILETEMYNIIGLNTRGPGENVVVAFMAYPNTEEDSFIIKKEFLDNGGFRIYKYLTYKTIVKKGSAEVTEKLTRPEPRAGEPQDRYKYIQQGDPDSPINGLPMIGAPLRQGDCVIGKIQYVPSTKEVRNESVILRVGDEGIVTSVKVTSDGKTTVVTVKLRVMRVPQEGDKFAPRNAQKGTVGLIMSDIDMPCSENGIIPDFIVNTHCFTSDTPVTLKNGLAKPLTSMKYNGGNKVWSWDKDQHGFVDSETMGYDSKGIKDIVKLTLSDGRTIRCTPDHRFPILEIVGSSNIYRTVSANQITNNMYMLAGIDGVLDSPTYEERQQELVWSLSTKYYTFNMNTEEERDRSLAFARLIGIICTDGCISEGVSGARGNIVTGSYIDANTVLDDIQLITGKRPTISINHSDMGGDTLTVALPSKFAQSIGYLDGMTIGRRTTKVPEWPSFLLQDNCPKSIIREFLGGAFGGDGWAPYLKTNKQDGKGTVTFNPPAISQSSTPEQSNELTEKMEDLARLLEIVGVPNARVDKPKIYNNGNKDMVSCVLQIPRGVEFGDKVGFRYCIQKMYRLAAYQSYMKYLFNVKRQNNFVISKASEIYDSKESGRSLMTALEIARRELFSNEEPFNEYYSYGTIDQVRNRRRKNRHNEVMKWDYTYIEDADKYLHKIGAYHWFRTEQGAGGADYIIKRDDTHMPNFLLKLHDIRAIGQEEVFDLGVWKTHTLIVSGIAALNCVPSRMTMEYIMELLASKHGAMRGVHINGSAFRPFNLNEYRKTMLDYGFHEFGYERMRSGTSGKYLEALIYMGPVYFQALRHHVKDKIQYRSTGQVKPMTRQPPKGRGNRGGLRFGEMERDAAISHGASSFLRERLMFVSDGYQTAFCKTCGIPAINDAKTRVYKPCRLCGDQNYGRCTIPYAYKLLFHLLAAPGINLRPEFLTSDEYIEKILTANKTSDLGDVNDIGRQLIEADEALIEEEAEFGDQGLDTNYGDIYD